MNRPTLGMLRNSRLPALIAECAANLNVIRALVNEAQERLLTDPLTPAEGWWGGWASMAFTVSVAQAQGYIIAPREVARLTDLDIYKAPVQIRNSFYEYMAFGTGLRSGSSCCANRCRPMEAFERETVATLADLSADSYVQAFPTNDGDIGQSVIIQGKDDNGKTVYGQDVTTGRAILGETLSLEYPFTQSVNKFSSITGIMKSPTLGEVTFEQYDGTTSSALSSMAPGETIAQYRKYFLNGLPTSSLQSGVITVSANAKLDLIPAMSDQDYLFIQSIPAIMEEMQALRYGSMDSLQASKKEGEHHSKALRLLFGQLDHYQGKTTTAISVPIFGSDRLAVQPR